MEQTYQMATDPPPPMSWDDYEKVSWRRWQELLGSSVSESEVQYFLELNPAFLPVQDDPLHQVVFAQPPLPGIERRVPDFMWLSANSGGVYPVLVEIEAPHKKWFTEGGIQRAELTQALDQITEWRMWFNKPANVATFCELYRIPNSAGGLEMPSPHYVLVYGRRSEFDQGLLRKRVAIGQANNVEIMTFDRLQPSRDLDSITTVKIKRRDFLSVAVPPTFRIGPANSASLPIVKGFDASIENCNQMTTARQDFLRERIVYWKGWAEGSRDFHGMHGDWE